MRRHTSTLEEERGKARTARVKARAQIHDTFEHLFAMMDETLAELKGEPQLIESKTNNKKAKTNGSGTSS